MDERTRSRSPRRKPDSERARPKRSDGGFRWKDKKRDDDPRSGWDERRLERGYRDREDRGRVPPKEKDPDRDQARYRDSDRERDRERERERDRERKGPEDEARREKKKKKKAAAPEQPSEPMITVIVNDRLGTKAAIPCLGSDPIKLFKAQVAARIGREPHEILLKRQGERPFKDQLTLDDYGVSNGVQLDLEVATGD